MTNFKSLRGLKTALATVIKKEDIDAWLEAPNRAFGSRKPIDLVKNKEWRPLRNMIYYLQSGVPS